MISLKHLALAAILAIPALMMATSSTNESVAELKIGAVVPDFTLTDLDGKAHTLSDYTAAGNIVVLEWFSPSCPFVRKHYRPNTRTMLKIQADHESDKIIWLRINSAHSEHPDAAKEFNQAAATGWGITTPILLDPTGKVGKSYGAKRTPGMYIINPDQTLVYHGAIDERSDAAAPGKTNYVAIALTELLAGDPVTKPETKPYGCIVKYD